MEKPILKHITIKGENWYNLTGYISGTAGEIQQELAQAQKYCLWLRKQNEKKLIRNYH